MCLYVHLAPHMRINITQLMVRKIFLAFHWWNHLGTPGIDWQLVHFYTHTSSVTVTADTFQCSQV
jgi:hypothetical protein